MLQFNRGGSHIVSENRKICCLAHVRYSVHTSGTWLTLAVLASLKQNGRFVSPHREQQIDKESSIETSGLICGNKKQFYYYKQKRVRLEVVLLCEVLFFCSLPVLVFVLVQRGGHI